MNGGSGGGASGLTIQEEYLLDGIKRGYGINGGTASQNGGGGGAGSSGSKFLADSGRTRKWFIWK